jgi:hypothetical protein
MDAQAHALEVMQLIKDRYTSDECQIIATPSRHGESVMPHDARYYDPEAEKSWKRYSSKNRGQWIKEAYTRLIVDQQRILIDTPWREAWFFFHLPKGDRINTGVQWFEDYINALPAGVNVNHITFTLFDPKYIHIAPQLQHLRDTYNTREWVGAEYCEGLRDGNGNKARRALGLRGLLLGPTHQARGHDHIEPWMLDVIRKEMG